MRLVTRSAARPTIGDPDDPTILDGECRWFRSLRGLEYMSHSLADGYLGGTLFDLVQDADYHSVESTEYLIYPRVSDAMLAMAEALMPREYELAMRGPDDCVVRVADGQMSYVFATRKEAWEACRRLNRGDDAHDEYEWEE